MKKAETKPKRGRVARAALLGGAKFNKPTTIAIALMASIIGIYLLLRVFAASTNSVAIEAESGSRTSGASVTSDAAASAGQAVQFNAASTSGPTTLPNPGTWTNITGNLANMPASCGNFGGIWPVPGSMALVGGVGQVNLFKSASGGSSWSELGGSGPKVANRVSVILYDPVNPNIFYESGSYGGGGVFKTTDGGATFTQLGDINHLDYLSVDFSDPNRQTMIAGSHEAHQKVYKSSNGGQTWTDIGGGLPANSGFSSVTAMINSQTYIVSTPASWSSNFGNVSGIFRTTNGGGSWSQVSTLDGNSAALVTPSGTIYLSSGDGLVKSSDNGITWTKVGSGLRYEFRPNILPDGRLVSVNNNNHLVVSADGGNTWTEFGAAIPNSPNQAAGVSYSPANQAFYIWHWDCGNAVLPDAIMRLQ